MVSPFSDMLDRFRHPTAELRSRTDERMIVRSLIRIWIWETKMQYFPLLSQDVNKDTTVTLLIKGRIVVEDSPNLSYIAHR